MSSNNVELQFPGRDAMRHALSLHSSTVQTIRRRKALLLDTSVWITLADGKSDESRVLRDSLRRLAAQEKIFCPLTAPAVWELRKQARPSLTRTAALMEELSLNVSFRSVDEIMDREIDHLLDYLRTDTFSPLGTSDIFGPVLSYLVPGFSLTPGPDHSNPRTLHDHLAGVTQGLSLTWLIDSLGDRSSPGPTHPPRYQQANVARRELAARAGVAPSRIEQESLAQSILIPRLNEKRSVLPIREQLHVVAKVKSLPRSKRHDSALEHLLHFLPVLAAYAQVMTVAGLDPNRKDRSNDFYDRETLIYALSYSSAFAAFDSWIRSLIALCVKERFPGVMPYCGDTKELASYLACAV